MGTDVVTTDVVTTDVVTTDDRFHVHQPPIAAAWDRWVRRTPLWLLIVLVLALYAAPVLLGLIEGRLDQAFASGEVRFWFLWPTLIVYTLGLMPFFLSADRALVESVRPLVQLDDAEFERLLQQGTSFNWRAEVLAFVLGMLFGMMVISPAALITDLSLANAYLYLSGWVAFGSLGWMVLEGLTSTRLAAALYNQPMTINLFDLAAFQPVGRQSLLISIAIVGGILISLLFIFDERLLGSWQNLVVYSTLILLAVLLFFANMWSTHKLLADTKRAHLARIKRRIGVAYDRLDANTLDGPQDEIVKLSAELRALIAAEQRLKLTRTWPYNTETLRTLVISVFMPLALAFSRLLAVWFVSAPGR